MNSELYPSDARMDAPAESMSWYQAWWHVWSHPGAQAFRDILRDPNANASRGFLWVAVMALIIPVAMLSVTRAVFELACIFLLTPVFAMLGLAISAAIYHFVAKLFGGNGTWDSLVYALAAITAPSVLLSLPSILLTPLFSLFNSGSPTGSVDGAVIAALCLGLISLVVGIYVLVLYISAISAVENIGTGMAILTYFMPSIIAVAIMACLFFGVGGLAFFQGLQYYNP